MKKRLVTFLATSGLVAAMLPAAALAQAEGEVALTFALNPTCEFGQGSEMEACAPDESGESMVLTYSNPQRLEGVLEGIAVLNGTYIPGADGTFATAGTVFFAGEAEGCGVGTLYLDYAGSGTFDENGMNVFESDVYTIVPGGTLAASGGYEQAAAETQNDDGTGFAPYTASITCETAETAEADEAAEDG